MITTGPQSVCGGTLSRRFTGFLICAFGAAVAFLAYPVAGAASPLPELSVDTPLATAGYYRLQWRLADAPAGGQPVFELQESASQAFDTARTLYRGPDLASVLSGRSDGERYYRVRAALPGQAPGPWSQALAVLTQHHPMSRALGFFVLGAVVFALTLALVLVGGTRHNAGRG